MPPNANKEARMACSVSGKDVFIRQLEGLRSDCSEALAHHLLVNPDVTWTSEDGSGDLPHSKREKAIIAPGSAVKIPHGIDRQMVCHKPTGGKKAIRYKGKAGTRDVVAAEHHHCAGLPSLDTEGIMVCPLWKANGYNACGGPPRGSNPSIMQKEFFNNHGIVDIDYAFLTRPYKNLSFDNDEKEDEKINSDRDMEVEDTAEPRGGVATGSNEVADTPVEEAVQI